MMGLHGMHGSIKRIRGGGGYKGIAMVGWS